MLVLDLDGTTLRGDKTVAPEDVAAAHALRRHGVHVTIATGRLFTGTRPVARQLGVDGRVAVMNGSELVDVQSGAAHHGHYLPPAAQVHVREVLARHGVSTFLYHSRRIHYAHQDAHLARYLGTWSPELHGHDDVGQAADWAADDVVAVCAAGAADDVHAAEAAFELPDGYGTELFDTWSGSRFMKVRSAVEDKGTAVVRLAAERGLRPEDVVVVGDWTNDLPMFAAAGLSFAMGGSHVQGAADAVLDAPMHGGGAIAEVARRVWGV